MPAEVPAIPGRSQALGTLSESLCGVAGAAALGQSAAYSRNSVTASGDQGLELAL